MLSKIAVVVVVYCLEGVYKGQNRSQKIHLDKRINICFMHFLSKHPLIAKKWSQSLKNRITNIFTQFCKHGKLSNVDSFIATFTFNVYHCSAMLFAVILFCSIWNNLKLALFSFHPLSTGLLQVYATILKLSSTDSNFWAGHDFSLKN